MGTEHTVDDEGATIAAIVERIDALGIRTVVQLGAEVPDLSEAELRSIIDESSDLILSSDTVYSRASLVAGRVFTTAVAGPSAIVDINDFAPFLGAQRRLAALTGVPLVSNERTVVTVGSVSETLDGAGGYIAVALPTDVSTSEFGAVVPDRFEVQTLGSDRMASGEIEVAALRSAIERWIPEHGGTSARQLVAYAISLNDRCFRTATLPLSDLFAAAGLEERAGEWGRSGQAWSTTGEGAAELEIDRLVSEHGLSADETGDFTSAVLQWQQWVGGRGTVNANSFVALLSGRVAAAFAEYWQPVRVASIEAWMHQRRLVETLARKFGDHPGVNYLRGMIDLRLGDGCAALGFFERAHAVDEDFLPVRTQLGLLYLDAAKVEEALDLMPSDVPAFGAVEYLIERASQDRTRADRGDSCRCGSQKKYRSCCARRLRFSDADTLNLIDIRLKNYLSDPPWSVHMERLADIVSTEWGLMSFPEALADPFVQDVLTVEAGGAASYLAARRGLLTDDDVEVLAAFVPQSRDAFDVTDLSPTTLSLLNPDTGVSLTIDRPEGPIAIGDAVLIRTLVRSGVVRDAGPAVIIPASHVSLLRITLASRPTAEQLLGWVSRRPEILRPALDLTSQIDLRSPVGDLGDVDLDDLARRAMES